MLFKEQSLPPYPLLHVHDTEHRTSNIEQTGRMFPEGSEYLHAPLDEQIFPTKEG